MCQNSRQEWLFVPKENSPLDLQARLHPLFLPSGHAYQWRISICPLPGRRLFLSLTLQCVQQFLSLGDLGGDNADSVGEGQAAAAGAFFSAFSLMLPEALQSLGHCSGPSVGKSQSLMTVAIPPHMSSHQPLLPSSLLSEFFLCHCVMISSKNFLIEDSNARKKE